MTGALIIFTVTLLTGVILYLTRGKEDSTPASSEMSDLSDLSDKSDPSLSPTPAAADSLCCGRHAVCEKGLLNLDELYYDDEELDRYAGRQPDSYTPEEVNEFREVLYTLNAAEVHDWGMALTQRDIPLPVELRDEWVMLCG